MQIDYGVLRLARAQQKMEDAIDKTRAQPGGRAVILECARSAKSSSPPIFLIFDHEHLSQRLETTRGRGDDEIAQLG